MVIIYLFLFCSSVYSADFDLATSMFNPSCHKLRAGMWGTSGYEVPTLQLVPLTEENISTPFFVELQKKSAQEKGELLTLAKEYPYGDYSYCIRRRNIAALVKIAEANPKVVQNSARPNLVYQATLHQDIALVALLLSRGADVDEPTCLDYMPTPIHHAQSVPFVQLFEEYGAFEHKSAPLLLHTAMDSRHDIALVPYYKKQYKKYNLSLLAIDEFKHNILMSCVLQISCLCAKGEVIEKIKALFQDLPDETVLTMINYSSSGKNVMQYIQEKLVIPSSRIKNVLISLQILLQWKLDNAFKQENTKEQQEVPECAICFDELVQNIVKITACCNQSLHGDCLQKWIALGNGCPLCRSAKPE